MTRILFVCHGNICRSPMAEFVMKRLVEDRDASDKFLIASAATSTEEIGNPVYPPARRELLKHDITCDGKTARQIKYDDFEDFDMIVVMDNNNMRNIKRFVGDKYNDKVFMLMSFADMDKEVADPWYTGNFEETWDDIYIGCKALLEYCEKSC